MTENSHDKENWEEKINALLDGELDPNESEQLKWAASNDQDLARSIVEAYQLQRAMEHVQVEKAPAFRAVPTGRGRTIQRTRALPAIESAQVTAAKRYPDDTLAVDIGTAHAEPRQRDLVVLGERGLWRI